MHHIRTKFIVGLIVGLLIVSLIGSFSLKDNKKDSKSSTSSANSQSQKPEPPSFNKKRYSTTDPASPWVVVNKKRPMPAEYAPTDMVIVGTTYMRAEAAAATSQLMEAAKAEQIPLKIVSGYRSYQNQQNVYNSYVQKDGVATADTYSARPGFSEHQTGLAVDLGNINGACSLDICFADTPSGKWLAAHAHEYGFIIRYLEEKTNITGYQHEPWHIRYVGKDLSTELHTKKQTMEEFFDLPSASTY